MGFNATFSVPEKTAAMFSVPEKMTATFSSSRPMMAEFDESPGSGGGTRLPPGGKQGDLLAKRSDTDNDIEWITPANSAEQDNTRPITAAAVYMEIGNINALLATI